MEADGGVKAPVTRLRRRMSVEQSEESKSPAINTPTKKRGGRRAAKPDLDLIDENNPDNNIKTTAKNAAVKEIIDTVEEKPVTPSRRSTRIKSNTSIISDIALAIDSPRAKRAARRTSQIGSDTEAPPTPVRQTRRTRKDSTSSIEKVEIQSSTKPTIQITDIIQEEPESNSTKSIGSAETSEQNTSVGNVRRSPRLTMKIKQNTSITEKNTSQADNEEPKDHSKNTSVNKSLETSISKEQESEVKPVEVSQKKRHSLHTSSLLNNLSTEAKVNKVHLNKSTSAIESKHNKKRIRTMSWNIEKYSNEINFNSDNEGLRKKNNEGTEVPLDKIDKFNAGDGLNNSIEKDKINKSKSKEKGDSYMEEDIDVSMESISNKSMDKKNNESNGKLICNQSSNENTDLSINKLFTTKPSPEMQSTVYIDDDSDTNSGKVDIKNRQDQEDQCVPVIQHSDHLDKEIFQFSVTPQKNDSIKANLSKNDSCEPMDVDETIPDNSLIPEIKPNNVYSSSPCILLDKSESKQKQLNKSKRKSSIVSNLDKSDNENKSTLILSQLKDSSSGDVNNVTKSPQIKQSLLSKTTDDLNVTQENEINKKNLSLNYVTTSTPLQQKNLQKLGKINTSIIISNTNVKNEKVNISSSNKTSNNKDSESLSEEETNQNNVNEISKNESNLNKTKTSKENISKNEDDKYSCNDSCDSEDNKSFKKINKISNSLKKSVEKPFASTDSDDEMASSDESQESDHLIDDEAEDAGESYESGDSQDESEQQYLRENEIIEKGETLTSDIDLSNDSDYEKDSFVVSSAEEDNELLNGTEDDLSMSDNELKMTTKSKKKYDERKKKEQKKASREMYESRHKLNSSNKSSSSDVGNSKRRKHQLLSSSESDDETELISKKKNHRMRLDSSHEVSLQDNEDEKNISNNKRKRLSESYCDENVINEKEITVCNENLKDIDPLTANIKVEQKTPQKADSSIAFINTENDDELTKTQTELQDPLEDSMGEDSLSSDNENIIQNYDSVLEGLNKTSKNKSKTCDISLNIDKKKEKKKNTAIVDELNLTQVKSAKKNKEKLKENNALMNKKIAKPNLDRNSSPDTIDFHLLFSEDSNSSDNKQNNKNTANIEDFIPLKRIEGKTNIRENTDLINKADDISSPNVSYNKKDKKRKSEVASESTNENNGSFFIDTEGTISQCNNSLNKSSSKKNKKKLSLINNDNLDLDCDELMQKKDVSMAADENEVNENSDSEGPMDVPFQKEKRASNIQEILDQDGKDETDFTKDTCNKSVTKTPKSEKKKKKISESQNEEPSENENNTNVSLSKTRKLSTGVINEESTEKDVPEHVIEESLSKTPGSKKKKRVSEANTQEQDELEQVMEESIKTPGSKKKKRMSQANTHEQDEPDQVMEESMSKTPGSKKKKRMSQAKTPEQDTEDVPIDKSISTPSVISMKKKQLVYSPENVQTDSKDSLDESKVKTPGSQKKKKLSLISQEIHAQPAEMSESLLNTSKVKTPGSQKKKKVKEIEKEDLNIIAPDCAEPKNAKPSPSTGESSTISAAVELNDNKNTKKRKRKPSHTPAEETVVKGEVIITNDLNESLIGSQKKKRKVSQNEETVTNEPVIQEKVQSNVGKKNKLKKQKQSNVQNTTEIKTNKRKEREDDDGNQISKVPKENSFDTVHVPRLPASILKQLDDKPKHILPAKKPKLISTTQFSVVEARKRRNKPSNYLEDSVYLNDDELENKKQKKVLPKPKVLPFVPTVVTSGKGFTTNFKVNVIPTDIKFVAQSNTITNFKEDFLFNKNIRRHGTYELYKRRRNINISKF